MADLMITAEQITKRYGDTQALAGIDLEVPAGTVLGLLGPNGAGKTTAVRVFTTLTHPDTGHATVAGFDVVRDARAVRRHIGVAAQDATLDELLTGRQNLQMVGELSGLSRLDSKQRTLHLLEQFELTDAADRIMRTYSGGMRRRLDLSASMITRPPVLFLDEPTTGLDPASRQRTWSIIRDLQREGTTLLLTTQYLDEADQLADRIAVVDHGRVIANGTSQELKNAVGGARLDVTLTKPHRSARRALQPLVEGRVHQDDDGRHLHAAVGGESGLATAVVRALDDAGVSVDGIEIRQPSLDDVFFALTGNPAEEPVLDGALQ